MAKNKIWVKILPLQFPSCDLILLLIWSCCLQTVAPAQDPYAVQQYWFQDCPLEEMRVVGIDPGCRDFVTGVIRGDSKEDPHEIRCVSTPWPIQKQKDWSVLIPLAR